MRGLRPPRTSELILEMLKMLMVTGNKLPPLAICRMKMTLVRADSMPLRDAFFAEAMHHTLSSYDEDHANAAASFVRKEQPVFQGR